VKDIEDAANSIIQKNIPVIIENYDRGTAEQKYGFRIYQGGVVPVKSVRIVSIADLDIEACGGTHVKKTGDINLIKITRTKRIQDGVVRIEFVSGQTAYEYVKQHEIDSVKATEEKVAKEVKDKDRDAKKQKWKESFQGYLDDMLTQKNGEMKNDIKLEVSKSVKFYFSSSEKYDEYFHEKFGEKVVKNDPQAVYCGFFDKFDMTLIIVHVGKEVGKKFNAKTLVKELSAFLGGDGGGSATFAQGGGKDKSKKADVIIKAKSLILG